MDNKPFTAPGEQIALNGGLVHVRRFGNRGPVLVLECGLTMMSSCWGWLAPELAAFSQVIAYDRAGLGWSSPREHIRDANQLATELAALLAEVVITGDIILLGHSMGAMVNRAFARQMKQRVKGLIWLDPAHPDQFKRRGIRRRMRNLVFYIEAAQFLATKGIPAIEIPLVRHLDSLPPGDFRALKRFLRNPTHLRTCAAEARAWEASAKSLAESEVPTVPLLMISACKNALPGWEGLQRELAALSSRSRRLTLPEASHLSMLANRQHASKIAMEIRGFLSSLQL